MGTNSKLKAAFKSEIFTVSFAPLWVIFQNSVTFLVFTHVMVGLIDSCWLRAFREHANHHLNDEYERWNKQKPSAKDFTICYPTLTHS